jgi:hypothetical protein
LNGDANGKGQKLWSKASMGFISQYFDDKNYSKWRLKELIIKGQFHNKFKVDFILKWL